jgi:hypothetical protein
MITRSLRSQRIREVGRRMPTDRGCWRAVDGPRAERAVRAEDAERAAGIR